MLQYSSTGFPDPPLVEVDKRIMKACQDSVLSCLKEINLIATAIEKGYILLAFKEHFVLEVSFSKLSSVSL